MPDRAGTLCHWSVANSHLSFRTGSRPLRNSGRSQGAAAEDAVNRDSFTALEILQAYGLAAILKQCFAGDHDCIFVEVGRTGAPSGGGMFRGSPGEVDAQAARQSNDRSASFRPHINKLRNGLTIGSTDPERFVLQIDRDDTAGRCNGHTFGTLPISIRGASE